MTMRKFLALNWRQQLLLSLKMQSRSFHEGKSEKPRHTSILQKRNIQTEKSRKKGRVRPEDSSGDQVIKNDPEEVPGIELKAKAFSKPQNAEQIVSPAIDSLKNEPINSARTELRYSRNALMLCIAQGKSPKKLEAKKPLSSRFSNDPKVPTKKCLQRPSWTTLQVKGNRRTYRKQWTPWSQFSNDLKLPTKKSLRRPPWSTLQQNNHYQDLQGQ